MSIKKNINLKNYHLDSETPTKLVYVTIKLICDDDMDLEDFASECDYTFTYDGVLMSEMVDVRDHNNY